MRYRKPRQCRQPRPVRTIWERIERLERTLRLTLRKPCGVFESTGGLDGGNDRFELCQSAVLDGEANGSLLRLVSMAQRMDQRQRRLAFGQVVAQVLAASDGSER